MGLSLGNLVLNLFYILYHKNKIVATLFTIPDGPETGKKGILKYGQ
jgi:hypothetical protein